MALKGYQAEFINFLVRSGALSFGSFTLKSGRVAPYFVNTGKFNNGELISTLGHFYAAHMVELGLAEVDLLFGPAYKGIPLCVATSMALFRDFEVKVGFSFNRKEEKDHGDRGVIVGQQITDGCKVILVEDVITAGTTLSEIIPFIKSLAKVELRGVVISVDRCERGKGRLSAVQEASEAHGLKIYPLVTIHEIVNYLSSANSSGIKLDLDIKTKIEQYLKEYGAD